MVMALELAVSERTCLFSVRPTEPEAAVHLVIVPIWRTPLVLTWIAAIALLVVVRVHGVVSLFVVSMIVSMPICTECDPRVLVVSTLPVLIRTESVSERTLIFLETKRSLYILCPYFVHWVIALVSDSEDITGHRVRVEWETALCFGMETELKSD